MPLGLTEAIDQLADRSSSKRRSAAKRLRSLANPGSGPALLEALRLEVRDERTWETQYQMIMALGACGFGSASEFLGELASLENDYTMVGVALGDALVRIEWANHGSLEMVDRCLLGGMADGVVDGAFRAVAMLKLVPAGDLWRRIIAFVKPLGSTDPLRYWVAAAAAGWSGPEVEEYLRECLESERDDLVEVSSSSLLHKYLNHSVL